MTASILWRVLRTGCLAVKLSLCVLTLASCSTHQAGSDSDAQKERNKSEHGTAWFTLSLPTDFSAQSLLPLVTIQEVSGGPAQRIPVREKRFPRAGESGYVIGVDLQAGKYTITGISLVNPEYPDENVGWITTKVLFEVRPKTPDYHGALIIKSNPNGTSWETSVMDLRDGDSMEFIALDTTLVRKIWSGGRLATVAGETELRQPLTGVPVATAAAPGALDQPKKEVITGAFSSSPEPLGQAAVSSFPAAVQAQFKKFLSRPLPRAFAVSEDGTTGMASGGGDLIARAVAACRKNGTASKKASMCEVVAIDNTWLDTLLRPKTRSTAAK